MTTQPRIKKQLTAFLGELPEASAVKLFAALEADRLRGGKDLPHDALLDDLRRRLRERGAIFPARKTNAKRLFFTPFEDFLIGKRSGKKRRGLIARPSLDPIWRVLMTDSLTTQAALAAASLDDALDAGGETAELEHALFVAAESGLGELCARAREDRETGDALTAELGDELVYRDLQELRLLLHGVDFLTQLRSLVDSHTPALDEEQFYGLRKLFLAAYEQSRPIAAYLLLALKGRLERPWRALGVYYHLAQGADERLLAARDTVMVLPESLIGDIETIARDLESDCSQPLDAESSMMRVSYFTDYAEGLVKQAAKIGDNVFVNRIDACRDIVGEAHERFAEQALAALGEVMPVLHAGGSSRLMSLRPDIAKPITSKAAQEAKAAAALIRNSAEMAERLGADPASAAAIADEAREKTQTFVNNLVIEIRAAEGDERKAARRMLDRTLAFADILLTSEETGLIRDRAAAAAKTA